MIDSKDTTSTRPYLIRALYEWCTDNGLTPYVAVLVDESVRVPNEYVKDGEIVLNISFGATSGLKMENDVIHFNARFGGVSRLLFDRIARLLGRRDRFIEARHRLLLCQARIRRNHLNQVGFVVLRKTVVENRLRHDARDFRFRFDGSCSSHRRREDLRPKQLVGDQNARNPSLFADQLAQKPQCSARVTAALDQSVEHIAFAVHRTPEPIPFAVNGDDDFVQMPFVTKLRSTTADLIRYAIENNLQ